MEREEIIAAYRKGIELYNNGSYKEAFQQIYFAADHGLLPAVTLLGDMYFNGFGVEKDEHRALEYYCYAAEHDESTALCRVGTLYIQMGDVDEAINLFEKAFALGDLDSAFNLGSIYFTGYKGVKYYEKAIAYLEKVCSSGIENATAYWMLGRSYMFGLRDFEKATEYIKKAAGMGFEPAQKDLDCLELGGSIIEC